MDKKVNKFVDKVTYSPSEIKQTIRPNINRTEALDRELNSRIRTHLETTSIRDIHSGIRNYDTHLNYFKSGHSKLQHRSIKEIRDKIDG